MSYFAEELERQLTSQNTNPLQLSGKIATSPGQLYKWLRSEQTSISDSQLTAIACALSDDLEDHIRLATAHLHDEKFGPGKEHIRIASAIPKGVATKSRTQRSLEFLAERARMDPRLNEVLINLAQMQGAKV